MKRNTKATLAELRIGDRFMMGADIWQVTEKRGTQVFYNKFINGKKCYMFDMLKKDKTEVEFLRHTVAVPYETIFICDLALGDVFTLPE
jgi:hypothetical protein